MLRVIFLSQEQRRPCKLCRCGRDTHGFILPFYYLFDHTPSPNHESLPTGLGDVTPPLPNPSPVQQRSYHQHCTHLDPRQCRSVYPLCSAQGILSPLIRHKEASTRTRCGRGTEPTLQGFPDTRHSKSSRGCEAVCQPITHHELPAILEDLE